MDYRYKRLISHSVWNFVGNTGSKIVSFLLLPFYTKWLGTEGYGFSDLITTYSTLFGGLITLCLSDAILIFVKDKDIQDKKGFYTSATIAALGLCFIWGVLFLLLRITGVYGGFIISNIGFIYGMIVTNFLQTSTQSISLALDKIRVYSFSGLVHCLTIFVFSWILIPQYGIYGYVFALILSNVLTSCYSFFSSAAWKYINVFSVKTNRIKELLKYSIPLIPNVIMWWLVSALNRPIMEGQLGLSAVGIFAVAQKFPGIITLLFSIFSISWTVSAIEEFDKPDFVSFHNKIFRTIFSGLVVCSLLLMLFSELIIQLLTTKEFYEAYKYMVILIMGAYFSCLSNFWGTSFGIVKQTQYYFYSSLWGALTAIILNYILIPRWGILGATLSVVCSFVVMAVSRYIYSLKFVKSDSIILACFYALTMIVTIGAVLFVESLIVKCLIVFGCITIIAFIERDNLLIMKRKVFNRLKR